jgi:hypothetical protein
MSRAEIAAADLARITAMSQEEFRDEWGEWARLRDRDVELVRTRWISDLRDQITWGEQEDLVLAELVAAKDAYRADPNEATKARKARAVAEIVQLRSMERISRLDPLTGRPVITIGGDAWAGVR